MLSINTNLSSLIAQRSMRQSTNRLNQAIERMTTGAKINHAKDNAANYNIATNMTIKLGALQVAEDNCAMGLDMLATANGTLDQIHDKLQRLRDLAVQSSNGTYGLQSKQAINAEANALVDEIERLYNTSEYNGINLMKGQVTGTEECNFIKDIDRRDTSKMTTLASVDVSTKLNSGTYSISTPEELAKLATMTNNGLIGACCEFVLANDIDLSGYSSGEGWTPIGNILSKFQGSFDGNGYVVSNLYINRPDAYYQGLFGYTVSRGGISNLAVENCNIIAGKYVGVISGESSYGPLSNCFSTGKISASGNDIGGLTGYSKDVTIKDCYAACEVIASGANVGGLIGFTANATISKTQLINCYSFSSVSGSSSVGGLIGCTNNNLSIQGCYSLGDLSGYYRGAFIGDSRSESNIYIENSFYNINYQTSGVNLLSSACVYNSLEEYNNDFCMEIINPDSFNSQIISYDANFGIQVGTSSDTNSLVSCDISLDLGNISLLDYMGLKKDFDYLSITDNLIKRISMLQVQLGSTENRLNSALDEISTQYENLISSRSTIQDADIAEVSSEYIRQQILQQASATLMATANQSASIALSLI